MTVSRAVLLVGSAKPDGTSTSEALGRYLVARLAERGVATKVMHVGRAPAAQAEERLVAALADADLFVLATPLYVDSLPYLVTRALESVAESLSARRKPRACVAIVNCGFPEAEHCQTALAIARAFARRAGFEWAGGLALGEGAAIDGRPLETLGALTRHVRAALDRAATDLATRHHVSPVAVDLMARRLMPARVYTIMGNLGWRRRAAHNRMAESLDAKPFEFDAQA